MNMQLKKFWFRQLKNGYYVIVANNTSPIMMDPNIAKSIIAGDTSQMLSNPEILEIFQNNNFFEKDANPPLELEDKRSSLWNFFRYTLLTIGFFSFVLVLIFTISTGIPTGDLIIPFSVPLTYTIVLLMIFRTIVAFIHEFMHMFFGGTLGQKRWGFGFSFSKGVFFVSMSHVWTWSLLSRITAISAGIISDLFILMVLTMLRFQFKHWLLDSTTAIMWAQILWQFQFNTKCDGHLLALNVLDDPFIHIDAKEKGVPKTKNHYIWKIISAVGYAVSVVLFLFWVIPFALGLFRSIANYF